jgi:LacI family transcriptional regulator
MNINEIARRARVSVATVSRAINRVPTVDRRLARRVLRVAHKFGYYPNTHARSLVSGKSRIVGLIIPEIVDPFVPQIVQAFEDIALRHDYEILLSSTVHDPKRAERAVRRMIEHRVEGVAILTFGLEHSLIEALRLRNVRVIFVGAGPRTRSVSNIQINYQEGLRQAVQHLAALRHERIAFITESAHSKSPEAQRAMFEQSLHEIGLSVSEELIVPGNHTMEGGMSAASMLAKLPDLPTAVICWNDLAAIGVLQQAYHLGIQVPHDLSVIGFGDTGAAQCTIPPLTTIRVSQVELANMAFMALVGYDELLNSGGEYVLQSNLVLRRSTALMSPTTPNICSTARESCGRGSRGPSIIHCYKS